MSSLSLAKFATPAIRAAPVPGTRTIANSASSGKALPFSLHGLRAGIDECNNGHMLRMLMFGKPGAGKGTLSSRLVKKYDILTISTGDLLRQHIAEGTQVGRQAGEIVAQGGLVPDDLMLKVVTSKLDALHDRHWILDGFPRTLGQGKLLDTHLESQNKPLTLIVNLDIPDEVILGRISDRWVHLPSGRVYNMSYNRPKVDGLDDETEEPLTKRPDDHPVRCSLHPVRTRSSTPHVTQEVFSRRLKQFYASTSPLLSYYASNPKAARLVTLQGETSDEIWPKLEAAVLSSFPGLRERLPRRRGRHSLSNPFVLTDKRSSRTSPAVWRN
ncbi:adenylate kinase [Boletus reticuloceps]|uniref:Adenylate kinase n=1 Tax=Boletus reticuloceps TaxID=495285 RepID=A0A8I3AAL6_9AGAM|nr:adenylate kinase [Boletus reticuloceps]